MKRLRFAFVVLTVVYLLASEPARSADLELSVDAAVLEETRRILNDLPVIEYEGVRLANLFHSPEVGSNAVAELVALLPGSGNALISMVADREDPVRAIAIQMLAEMGEDLSFDQLEALVRVQSTAYVESKPRYPKGVNAYVGTGYRGIVLFEGATVEAKSYKYLDGVAYGDPFKYPRAAASSGGVPVAKLGYGKHTVQAVTEYEVTYRGKTMTGRAESPVVTFEIIQAITPDMLAAPMDQALASLVRRSCRFVEVRETGPDAVGNNLHAEDPWKPDGIAKYKGSSDSYAYHLPLLVVSEPLPVDLCFDVELHVVETGEVFEGNPMVVPKGRVGQFNFGVRNSFDFARLREGYIPIKAVLKPSQATALSRNITNYYTGTLTSPVLRARTYWFLQASAEPWLVELQSLAEKLEREGTVGNSVSEWFPWLTSANCYERSRALTHIAKLPGTIGRPMIPFLVVLLQDTRTHLPTQPADLARDALVGIDKPAVDPLIAALANDEPLVRAGAATTLGRMPDPRVMDALIAALADVEPDVRHAVVSALGELKDERTVAPLEAALRDADAGVRKTAAEALSAFEMHDTVVAFPDENLEKKIRLAIKKPTGEIRAGDLVDVGFVKLSAAYAHIKNLTGLEHCKDLSTIQLGNNAVSDLRPLAELKKLEYLHLGKNQVADLTPLSDLPSLIYVDLSSNPVATVAPLSSLTQLTHLELNDISLTDIGPLSTLTNLETLNARQNQISDISALSELASLDTLGLRQNNVVDLSPLSKLDKLTALTISANQVSNLDALSKLRNLRFLTADGNSITSLKPLEKLGQLSILNLSRNPIDDIGPLAKLERLRSLGLGNTKVADLSPLSTLTNLKSLDVTELDADNVDFAVLATLTSLTSFRASYNGITDIAFVGQFSGLQHLHLAGNGIEHIENLAGLVNLESISLESNRISDIRALDAMVHLKYMFLENNLIVDIGPLANESMLAGGASVHLQGNPLNCQSIQTYIPALKEHGVSVNSGAICVGSITPSVAPNSGPVSVEIQVDFEEGNPSIVLGGEQQPPIKATAVEILAPGRIVCTFDLTGATPGALDLVVSLDAHGWQSGTSVGAFTVTDAKVSGKP